MIRHVSVIVPAADEEDNIASCLASLARAVDHLHDAPDGTVSADVVVVLDACGDRTAEILAGFADVRTVAIDERCVGAARAAGARVAAGIQLPPDDVWLASTDADTLVPTGWLTYMVRAANAGADLVLGTVRPSRALPEPLRSEWLRAHRLADGHPHVHGANLGIRAATLQRLGGWRRLHTGEDVDLVARASAAGARIVRTDAIPTRTSARVDGRAPAGFSHYLRGLSA